MRGVKRRAQYTYEDLCRDFPVEDEVDREILDGDLETMPRPPIVHQRASGKLGRILDDYAGKNSLGDVLLKVDVVLAPEDVLIPDLVFVSKRRRGIVKELHVSGAPDLVVEVISPGSHARDLVRKRRIYERFGVPNYWIVDPEERRLEELVLESGRYVPRSVFGAEEAFRPAVFPRLRIDLRKIWAR